MSFYYHFVVIAVGAGAITLCGASHERIIRGRNEGTFAIAASNVIGSGNITLYSELNTDYGFDGLKIDPVLGGTIGIGNLMQLSAQGIPYSLKRGGLGTLEAHLQATLPGNDRLRFFGAAVSADLYLTTTIDTISSSTELEKPDYHSHILSSVTLDFDFISRWKRFPLKLYVCGSLVDNPQQLFRYNQLCIRYGLEWKMVQHALFIDCGSAWYRELPNKLNGYRRESGYGQAYCWVEPGGRYRIFNRFSVVGAIRMSVYQKTRNGEGAIYPPIVGLSLRLEAPLIHMETNTEAIRSLIFVEQQKERNKLKTVQADSSSTLAQQFNRWTGSIGAKGETFDYAAETEQLIRERQEIQKKMEEIQRLLEGIDSEEETSDDSWIPQE